METEKLHEQKAPKKAQSQQPRLCLALSSEAEPGNE